MKAKKIKVNRSDLRLGDEVCFTNKSADIVGVVEKINRKSIKVRQTNDDHRYTQAGWGHSGGRKYGGRGVRWSCVVGDDGSTNLCFTDAFIDKMEGTSRGIMFGAKQKSENFNALNDALSDLCTRGVKRKKILEIVDKWFAK